MLPEVVITEEPMPWYEKAYRKFERGWENVKNTPTMTTIPGGHPYMASQTFPTVPSTVGQDLSVAKAAALPYFMGATPVQAYMAAESGYNLASENGVRKTKKAFDEIWASDNELMAQDWSTGLFGNPKGSYFEVTYPKNAKVAAHNGQMNSYSKLPPVYPGNQEPLTHIEDIADYYTKKGYDILNVGNVLEGNGFMVNDTYIAPKVPRKSLVGGNGNFDLNDKNIYKGLLPFTLMTSITGIPTNE